MMMFYFFIYLSQLLNGLDAALAGNLNKSAFQTLHAAESVTEDSLHFFLVRQRWHTGIVVDVKMVDTLIWPEITFMKDFRYLDVGWGDEEFYQYPGFDAGLAVKALFYPTPSVLRIHGFNIHSQKYAEHSDVAIKIHLNRRQFNLLCSYISETYFKNEQNKIIPIKNNSSNSTIFFKAKGSYHLFNTCNTWIARGLLKSGFDLNPTGTIFTEDLFRAADEFGILINNNKAQE